MAGWAFMVARRPWLRHSAIFSSTRPGYAGDHKGPPHAAPPLSPLQTVNGLCVRLMPIGRDESRPYELFHSIALFFHPQGRRPGNSSGPLTASMPSSGRHQILHKTSTRTSPTPGRRQARVLTAPTNRVGMVSRGVSLPAPWEVGVAWLYAKI